MCLILVCMVLAACGPTGSKGMLSALSGGQNAVRNDEPDQTEWATVIRVIDGDTFVVLAAGKEQKVRLIGVNTPEIHHPIKGVEYYGREAGAYTEKLLRGKKVRLDTDVEPRDRYGRLLAYAYLEDGTFVNAHLVEQGYAQVMTVPPNVRFTGRFIELQREARAAGRGLWAPKGDIEKEQAADGGVAEVQYVGNRRSHKFHRMNCTAISEMSGQNRVEFADRAHAAAAGYSPCGMCKP